MKGLKDFSRNLQGVKEFLGELVNLQHLTLTNLLLDRDVEATNLLDEVIANCMLSIETLNIVNITRVRLRLTNIFLEIFETYS